MLELELFYKIVESAIRGEHVDYLKGEKRVPLPLDLPEVTTLTKEEFKALGFFGKIVYKYKHRKEIRARKRAERRRPVTVDDKLLKGYNAGISKALKILRSEWFAYEKRFKTEDNGLYK